MKYGDLTLGQVEAVVNKLGGMDGVQRFLSGELLLRQPDQLQKVASVQVSGVARFIASDHLKSANIGYVGDHFKKLFLNMAEVNAEGTVLAISRLERASPDAPILAELGERAETQLAHFFSLLEKQAHGETGHLLVNGFANIAYIRGNDGNLWAVHAHWDSGRRCWLVFANSVEYPHGWLAGDQVVSRDL